MALAAAGVAFACGFDFPVSLIQSRKETLLGIRPTDWVSAQIEDVVPQASDDLKADDGGVTAEAAELSDFGESRGAQLASMRAAKDGASAYAAGDGIPEAARLYIAGAVEFRAAVAEGVAKEESSAHAASALSYFERVLQLPENERASRATWASYMAGRALRLSSDATAKERASAYFQKTREVAVKGLPDPLSLAAASYGEEAGIALEKGDMSRATELYLEQAARGSSGARDSLRIVSERLLADADLTLRYIEDPRVQKLWFAAVLAGSRDTIYFDRSPDEYADQGDTWLARVRKVIGRLDRTKATQLDQLAVVAYATGRFDLAASVAQGVNTPAAAVVRAKLALRGGDRDAAAKEYAEAVRIERSAQSAGGTSVGSVTMLASENGLLALSRGDYRDALRILTASAYWRDAAYVAERVLTLDELTAFVKQEGENATAGSPAIPKALRLLLARRQMREQRFDEALQNFRTNDSWVDKEHPSAAALAEEYVNAVRAGTDSWTRVDRAAALFKAAELAQDFGMEILGYELAPDYAVFEGIVSFGSEWVPQDFAGPDELARFKATAPPETRFHYRRVASDLAMRAADNLPARSQAFAAVLCANWRWTRRSDDTATRSSIYQRYVREGAYVDWSPKFGGRCEAPDFDRASSFVWRTRMHAARVALRPYKIPLVALAVAGLAGIAVLIVRRRKVTVSQTQISP